METENHVQLPSKYVSSFIEILIPKKLLIPLRFFKE